VSAVPVDAAPAANAQGEAIIFVCDWIPPEFGAVGQYAMKRARDAARAGARVALIGLGAEGSEETEEAGRLTIVRLAAPRNPKESFLKRALWALAVNARLARATRDAQAAMGDCTINVSGSPPLLSYWLLLQNRLFWKKRIVYRMTDFYPEVALAAGKARWLAWAKPAFKALRRTAHQIADRELGRGGGAGAAVQGALPHPALFGESRRRARDGYDLRSVSPARAPGLGPRAALDQRNGRAHRAGAALLRNARAAARSVAAGAARRARGRAQGGGRASHHA
jgi:hypothetical protein